MKLLENRDFGVRSRRSSRKSAKAELKSAGEKRRDRKRSREQQTAMVFTGRDDSADREVTKRMRKEDGGLPGSAIVMVAPGQQTARSAHSHSSRARQQQQQTPPLSGFSLCPAPKVLQIPFRLPLFPLHLPFQSRAPQPPRGPCVPAQVHATPKGYALRI